MKKNFLYFFVSLVLALVLAKWAGRFYMFVFNVTPAGSFGVWPADTDSALEGFELSFLFLISLFFPLSTSPKRFLVFGAGWLILLLVLLTAWEVLMIGLGLSLVGILIGKGIKRFKKLK